MIILWTKETNTSFQYLFNRAYYFTGQRSLHEYHYISLFCDWDCNGSLFDTMYGEVEEVTNNYRENTTI